MTLPGLRRQYVKLCDLRDFDDPVVQERIDDIVPGLDPSERVHRKNWEYALLTLFLEDAGLLGDETRILSVGAGHETVLFWLANRVGKVVATDIYGEGIFSGLEADRTMLNDPASFSPYPTASRTSRRVTWTRRSSSSRMAPSTPSSRFRRSSTSARGRTSVVPPRRSVASCGPGARRSS